MISLRLEATPIGDGLTVIWTAAVTEGGWSSLLDEVQELRPGETLVIEVNGDARVKIGSLTDSARTVFL